MSKPSPLFQVNGKRVYMSKFQSRRSSSICAIRSFCAATTPDSTINSSSRLNTVSFRYFVDHLARQNDDLLCNPSKQIEQSMPDHPNSFGYARTRPQDQDEHA